MQEFAERLHFGGEALHVVLGGFQRRARGRFASFRVDRIREGDVVLVREDPSRAGSPGATRVLALPREPLLQADD